MKKDTEVRVRIAPSPTGAIHLGFVRTALYNWLFARNRGGRFILRIDDTDQQRNLEEALESLFRGLRWLGIDWDEGPFVGGPHEPYFQSQRHDRHRAAVEELLARGHAYRDYATPEEIAAEREAAIRSKEGVFRYSRRWMAETPGQARTFEADGRKGCVRLKMPAEGVLVIDDLVRGKVEFEWQREQDHVIMRSDGTFLYHLASIVDDHDMDITHVIRAEEHLSNTPRQVYILESLGWSRPEFAHLPVVAEPGSRSKLSKRKVKEYLKNRDFADLVARGQKAAPVPGPAAGADILNPVTADFYERVGFVPEALVNYLALLGWALDDRTEQFTRAELVKSFSLERVNKAPASFDPGRLMAFQVRHMLALPVEERAEMVMPFLHRAGLVPEPPDERARQLVRGIIEAAGDRVKVGADILDYRDFFVSDAELVYDEAAFSKRLGKPGAAERLGRFRPVLARVEPFDVPALEWALDRFLEAEGVKVGEVIHALRVAVTGKAVGFGTFETMAILGRDHCLARIDRALRMGQKERTTRDDS